MPNIAIFLIVVFIVTFLIVLCYRKALIAFVDSLVAAGFWFLIWALTVLITMEVAPVRTDFVFTLPVFSYEKITANPQQKPTLGYNRATKKFEYSINTGNEYLQRTIDSAKITVTSDTIPAHVKMFRTVIDSRFLETLIGKNFSRTVLIREEFANELSIPSGTTIMYHFDPTIK